MLQQEWMLFVFAWGLMVDRNKNVLRELNKTAKLWKTKVEVEREEEE